MFMWKNKNMWVLMVGIFGAEMGMWLGLIGNLEFLQRNVSSSFIQSLILIIGVVSGFISGPFIGNMIDSLNKKLALFIAGVIRILGILSMLLAIGVNSIIWMLISMVLIGVAASFYFPGIQAIIPLISDNEEDLIQANALQMNIMTLARIIGTALAGILLLLISLKEIYMYSLIAYIILLLSTFFLKFEENRNDEKNSKKTNRNKFREIFPVIKSKPMVFQSLILSVIPFIFISSFNLIVIEISNIHSNPSIKGLLYTVEGLSVIITGLLVQYLVKKHNIMRAIILSCVLIVISYTLLFFTTIEFLPFIAFFLFGVSFGLFMPLSATLYQKQISGKLHGRFFSFKRVYETGIGQISLLTIGLGLDLLGLPNLMIVLGMFSLILVTYVVLVSFMKNKKKKKINEVAL